MKVEDITLDWFLDRVFERDGCLIWAGHISGEGKVPQVRIDYRLWSVNRLVWQLAHGRDVPKGLRVGASCHVDGCVHPDHLVARKVGVTLKGVPLATDRKMKIAIARRAQSVLTEEDARAIRLDPRPATELVNDFPVHHSALCRIRRGDMWYDYSNPFTGLGA
jgi:hypothetical protein